MARRSTALRVLGGEPAFGDSVYTTLARVPERACFDGLVDRAFRSRWFTNQGALVEELEHRLSERMEQPCLTFSSGTTALLVALRALGLEGEVITTAFTFPATAHSVAWNGLTPVFCDVDPATYCLDPASAAAQVNERTCAILPVHVFGNACDVAAIDALATRNGLAVVYDAAHAFDVRIDGRPIAQHGDLSAFSFHATKLFHTAEGGAVAGTRDNLIRTLRLLRNFGIVSEDEVHGIGINGKMSELHAAMGLALLDGVAADIEARAAVDRTYRAQFADVPGLRLQRLAPGLSSNHAYFSLEVIEEEYGLSRDELFAVLRAENVIARRYFRPLCSHNAAYRGLPTADPATLPHAEALADRILCLPIYGDLGVDSAGRVAAIVLAAHEHADAVRRALAGDGAA